MLETKNVPGIERMDTMIKRVNASAFTRARHMAM
jgi:hypothetical protein